MIRFFPLFTLILALTLSASAQSPSNPTSTAVYVPDYSHANEPMPEGVLGWDALIKTVEATNGQESAAFSFAFTNLTTNIVAIISVRPGCHCTTVEMPATPWPVAPGSNGVIHLKVDLQGKTGTLFKSANFSTDKGRKDLMMRINIAPPPPMPKMTEAQRAAAMEMAKADRQAIFKGDCASCHLPKTEGAYGQNLYQAVCAICHEAEHRATMVPDLHGLTVPTNDEFWRTWITYGKAGTLMPAFASSQGGPLNDLQIASLAAYLNAVNPSHATNAPAK